MSNAHYADRTDQITELEQQNSNTVRRFVGEAAILLENKGVLPLSKPGKISLFGNAARKTVKGGTGSGCVNSRNVVNIENGLENEGFIISNKKWLDEYDLHLKQTKIDYSEEMRKIADERKIPQPVIEMGIPFYEKSVPLITADHIQNEDTEIAIYVLGRISGEGGDRFNEKGDYLLMDTEIANLTFLCDHFNKVILLLNVGGIIDIKPLDSIKTISAILYISQCGNQTGNIVADLLLGKVSPSGKLSTTWAANYNDYPSASEFSHINGNWHDEYYKEGIYVGYRYFDKFNITPKYCFGYGLGYSTFSIENTQVEVNKTSIIVKTTVKNTGSKFSGKEVVQVYMSAPNGNLDKPYQVLVGFGKSKNLQPGQTDQIAIECPFKYCASFCEESSQWILDAGTYIVRVGNSSRNTTICAKIELDILEQLDRFH